MSNAVRAKRPTVKSSAPRSGPFAQIPAAACFDSRLSDRAFRVLACLACHADGNHECHPKQSSIAARLELDQSAISRAIDQLVSLGYVEKSRHRRNFYHIKFGVAIRDVRDMRPQHIPTPRDMRPQHMLPQHMLPAHEENRSTEREQTDLLSSDSLSPKEDERTDHPIQKSLYNPNDEVDVQRWTQSREGRAFLFSRNVSELAAPSKLRYMLQEWLKEGEAAHA